MSVNIDFYIKICLLLRFRIAMNDNPAKLSVNASEIRTLSQLQPIRSILAVVAEWMLISGAVVLHIYSKNPFVYILCWGIIGTRMYALYSLLHEGIHFLLSKNKNVNDTLSMLFLATPLFVSLSRIRAFHFAHHQHLQTDEDPEAAHKQYSEFQFPKTRKQMLIIFLKDLSGINYFKYRLQKLFRWKGETIKMPDTKQSAVYLIVAGATLYFGWERELVLYWLLPYITLYQALNRLRLSTEHFHLPKEKIFKTRTMRLNFFERFILSPHNLGFHTEHHLYPSVPFYQLPTLHKRLMQDDTYKKNALISSSYSKAIKEYID